MKQFFYIICAYLATTPLLTFAQDNSNSFFRYRFRNRIFHNESICWNLSRVEEIHAEMLKVIGWMNRDLPEWVEAQERFSAICTEIRRRME